MSNNRPPDDEKKKDNEKTFTQKVLSGTADGLSYGQAGLKAVGEKLPHPWKEVADVVGHVSNIANDTTPKTMTDRVCGAVNSAVNGTANGVLTGGVGLGTAVLLPTPDPFTRASAGFAMGVAAQPVINEVVKPVGNLAEGVCRVGAIYGEKAVNSVTNYFKGPDTPKPQKAAQKEAAQKNVTEKHARDNAINGFKPNIPTTIPVAQQHSYRIPYQPHQYNRPLFTYIPFNTQYEVNRLLLGHNISFTDRLRIERAVDSACSYMNFQMSTGYSYLSGLGSFHSSLAMTGLISSYNSYNIYSIVRDALNSCGQIGGVATEVSLISDLPDSAAHAEAEEYFFCFLKSQFPFSDKLVRQIQKELATGYFKHKTLPFFSLHFNNDGFLYPVIHPAYEGTLVGEIIAFLDYWMKGFLNGGAFDPDFLKIWHETANCDEQYLRSKLIDLKKYCKEKTTGLGYISLRELESRYGLKSKKSEAGSAYTQPFMTSFRIIAYQEQVGRHGNILVPTPTFKVEYSIDLAPDYKEYLEKYHQEHGDYPEDYEHTRRCYELFAEEIKEKMPQLPFCRDYFQLLGMMNAFCYGYATFEKMGKVPVFPEEADEQKNNEQKRYSVPKSLPPLPVRYFRTYPVTISLKQIFDRLSSTDINEVDASLFRLFADRNLRSLPENIAQKFNQPLTGIVKAEVTKHLQPNEVFESNEDEIERINRTTERFLYAQMTQVHAGMNRALLNMLKLVPEQEQKKIKSLALPEKIIAVQKVLDERVASVKKRWEAKDKVELSQTEILQEFPSTLHNIIRDKLKQGDDEVEQGLKELIFICKKTYGTLSPQETASQPAELTDLQQVVLKEIEKVIKDIILKVDEMCSAEILELTDTQTQLRTIRQNLQDNVTLGKQEITRLQQHRASQLSKIPAHLHAINAANITAFVTPLDQEVARLGAVVADLENKINLIDADIRNCQNDINTAPARKAHAITETKKMYCEKAIKNYQESVEPGKKMARKQEALRLLEAVHSKNTEDLNQFTHRIHHFSETLLGIPVIADQSFVNQYTHTLLGFTSKDLAQKTGDNFQIIGGCEMNVPNLQSKPIEHAEEFSEALANAVLMEDSNSAEFTFNGKSYHAYRLPVQDVKHAVEQKSSVQTEAQEALLGMMFGQVEVESLSDDLIKAPLDPANAGMLHYAAAALDAESFNKILAKFPGDPLQLRDNLGNTPLHFAAQQGNVDVVKAILTKNPNLADFKNEQGITPLILAIQNNQLDVLKELITFKANANYRLPNGLFPLYIALQNNFTDMALWLISNVASLSISEEIDSKMTALHLAIESGALTVAKKLIESGANCTIKRKSDGFSPLHCAAYKGQVELIQMMLSKGVVLHTPLESGRTCLHIAAESGQFECLQYLMTQNMDTEAKTTDGETALMLAIKAGHLEEATLLAGKAAIDQVNKKNQTASLLALQYGMPSVSDILIARGENPDIRQYRMISVLDILEKISDTLTKGENLEDKKDQSHNVTYYLIRNGEAQRFSALLQSNKINLKQEYQGDNLLEIAAKYGQFLIVYDLLDEGTLKFRPKANGLSLMDYAVMADEAGFMQRNLSKSSQSASLACLAAKHGSIRCLNWLLKKINPKELKLTELIKAALQGSNHPKVIELLLQRCSDVNELLDAQGNTALHLSVEYGVPSAVELLLSSGSDVKLRNQKGHTVFHIALQQDDHSLLKRLLKKTKPSEWPVDLWQVSAAKPSAAIMKILEQYRKRIPDDAQYNPPSSIKKVTMTSLPTIKLNQKLQQAQASLEQLIEDENFDEAAELLETDPELILLFKSEQGAALLRNVFDHLHDYSELLASLEQEKIEELSLSSPDRLLSLLKQEGINPTLYTGKNNVLLAMARAETDKEAAYRLKMFTRYFSESLAALAMDEFSPKKRVVELTLKLNKIDLFQTLTQVCMQNPLPDSPALYGLHEAVASNNYDLVKTMLESYPVDAVNQKKQTPLMLAAALDNVRIMELLLEHGANPDKVDIFGQNALHYALHEKSEAAALCILPLLRFKNLADRHGITPLMHAASSGLLPVVRYLCEQNDYTYSFDKRGWNALHYAALEGQTETIACLEKHGFAVNIVESPDSPEKSEKCLKRTPLHLAALKGHAQAVRKLIELGAETELEDSRHCTVFEYTVESKSKEMLELMQEIHYSKDRNSQLLLASARVDNEEVLSQLILEDVNLNASNESGLTALHMAAIFNSGNTADLLLQGGDVAIDITDKAFHTPLQYAAELGHVRPLKLLCEAGANINYKNTHQPTALFMACEQGHEGAVAILLKHKADFSITNEEGLTPAQIAMSKGHVRIATRLSEAGDKSLDESALQQLSKTMQEKIRVHYQAYLKSNSEKKVSLAGALVQNGIYCTKKPSILPVANASTVNNTLGR